jgi:isoleucyl-tRNA synthetase
MAEDIWQNLPYPVAEASVFERGWPTVPAEWRTTFPNLNKSLVNEAILKSIFDTDPQVISKELISGPMDEIFGLRNLVNRQLQECRSRSMIGSSLEAQVLVRLQEGKVSLRLKEALDMLKASNHPEVDNLKDWLLVSSSSVTDGLLPPRADLLIPESIELGIGIGISRAEGEKCERCWHYETDIGQHAAHPTLCGRCVAVLEG